MFQEALHKIDIVKMQYYNIDARGGQAIGPRRTEEA